MDSTSSGKNIFSRYEIKIKQVAVRQTTDNENPVQLSEALLETKAIPGNPGAEEISRRVTRLPSTDEKPK